MKLPNILKNIFRQRNKLAVMQQGFVLYKNSTIHYYSFGSGSELLVAFHGYGEDGSSFKILEIELGKKFTIIAIDFPFHGKTSWDNKLVFTKNELLQVLQIITPLALQPFHLIGYSMGGRVALYMLQQFSNQIKSLVLIAPDGLHHNIWHKFSTQTTLGNKLFYYTMHYPKWLFILMKVATTVGLFNKSVYNFVQYYLKEKLSRLQLYNRWTAMRKFNPNLSVLKTIISNKHSSVKILFGKYDKIILTKNGLNFKKGNEAFVIVKEIEAGHQLLKEKHIAEITALYNA